MPYMDLRTFCTQSSIIKPNAVIRDVIVVPCSRNKV